MNLVRRSYVYLAAAISLEAVAWAVIAMIRNLLAGAAATPDVAQAFQLAVIVVGLPIFLFHWRWAQRLAGADDQERGSAVRRLYLYGLGSLFLIPFLANSYDLLATLLEQALGVAQQYATSEYAPREAMLRSLVAIAVMGTLWLYHRRLIAADGVAVPETGRNALVRRAYVLGFSTVGLVVVAVGFIELLRWTLFRLVPSAAVQAGGGAVVAAEVARLAIGVPLWILFWRWAERLAEGPDEAERQSSLRFFFLYATVFATVLIGVGNAATILAGGLRQILALPARGDIRDPLPVVLALAGGWLYYARVIRREAERPGETARQAGIRRLYHYLVAGVALAAFVFGLGGLLNVVFGTIGGSMTDTLKEQLAWSAAAVIAGLAVWVPPWRRMQGLAATPGDVGVAERASVVRKLYLYFFLYVATITVLSGAVYVVARLFMGLLGTGDPSGLSTDLPRALGYGLVGVGVWLYHGLALRRDAELGQRALADRLAALRTVLLDAGDGSLGRSVLDDLKQELPELDLTPIGLTSQAAEAMGERFDLEGVPGRLAAADLIIGLSDLATAAGDLPGEVTRAVRASPARKLLLPRATEGWDWAGVDRYEAQELAEQAVGAVKQIVSGETIRPVRPMGLGAIIAGAIGFLIVTMVIGLPIVLFLVGEGLEYLF